MSGSDSDDDFQLSASTLAALAAFRDEQQQLEDRFQKLHDDADSRFKSGMEAIPEDWQLSQFWYDDATAEDLSHLAKQAAERSAAAGHPGEIVFLSSPTAYVKFKELYPDTPAWLLEYDTRFAVYAPEFVHYDYNQPETFSPLEPGSAAVIVADPPFLSEECLTKTSATVRALSRPAGQPNTHVVLCTGLVMRPLARELLGLEMTRWRPGHAKMLSNDFRCYSNFTDTDFGQRTLRGPALPEDEIGD
ncbi:hypothetical protein H696_00102 [Fonticula alba]|uniref:Protein-lysine N-methyltransferase H696_00102 n=1 Tax=Fonticula alba TaxID=691883 RepID=A0A058ZF02_FONAL|nr:hypothetical protein H696_00102 [Fonticula alba]KCV72508.1 hypothetical protein H696_00102 [Fonticula alba]|eukprot:XP_009492209.1 hypothetical protein H696_00102 [Fonticula alba]